MSAEADAGSEADTAALVSLARRRIILGVSGGIAAYKAVEVCRRLVDAGAHVVPVLTQDAQRFVGAVTFSALASEPARTSLFDDPDPIPHTRLGQQADLVVVAPATAKLIGKYATGISDDLLTAALLATRAPVVLAPAMHTEMWDHPAVQENIATLRRRGVHLVPPEAGRLAGGDMGEGRLADPARIVAAAAEVLSRGGDLVGLRILVTAGGTREPIDPVRYLGNRSSGKMGHAIVDAAAARGAIVTLVTTTSLDAPPTAEVVHVGTAEEMAGAVLARAPDTDVIVMAAGVADFRPKATAPEKLKKADGVPEVVLEPTPDILAALGERKTAAARQQVLVGFAAETEQLREHAAAKLAAKHVDLMVANDVSAADSGFEVDTNRAILLDAAGGEEELPLLSKRALADVILDRVAALLANEEGQP
ncbi:MAG: bifunctional phosphopantothenoylcysteine decarboxylase/phosphopantothenate--cysteine ligase CoaBC [Actinobacteria bacterium]|nr:MAG: bifunctional phosphopantothenoylcysteine decarboxylase/phosphopantothenate--cysteine ligase CoaBC [Actinomycetota bacterium]